MSDSFQTTQIRECLKRMEAGDAAASDELIRGVGMRLERLARKMLGGFAALRGFVQTEDVLQNSLMRLLRALKEHHPESSRDFFRFAALQIRRELLDLARHFRPLIKQTQFPHQRESDQPGGAPWEPEDPQSLEDFDRWCAFHEEIERLDEEEREVMSLVFYHGLTQPEVAELFEISDRTVRRRWMSALLKIKARVN